MQLMLDKFYAFLDRPLKNAARILLAVLVVPVILHYGAPIWEIHMVAPQYPQGLELDIYSYKLEGGRQGKDIVEINRLNHYIGMHQITREDLTDLDWMPFAFGLLVILTLRVAAIGTVRSLVDLVVLSGYVAGFAFVRFVYTLYRYGHELDPHAPFDVEPFTPVIFGSKQLANFTTDSYPRMGSLYLGVFLLGIAAVLGWHLISGRRQAVASRGSSDAARPA
jgi:hypothetical protein